MQRDAMDAVPDLRLRIRNIFGAQALVDRLPGLSAVVGAEGARGGDGDEESLRISRVLNDGVETHPARARLPFRAGVVFAQAG